MSVGLASSDEPQSKLFPVEPDELDTLEALGVDPRPSAGTGGFLDPDEAFALSVKARDAHTIELRWRIADTYYLYRDQFGFSLTPDALESPRLSYSR